tara:strand:+ start:3 stop:2447 length:2445 start_codon:yes stop_codon:yes gene_type:complete
MTSSFQPQARPVDTFVRPSTVAPTTELDQLTRALQTVNPGINKFIDFRLDREIKKEQAIGINQEIQKSLNDGTFGKLTNKIRKKDGDDAARELIGGSIFRQKAAERMRAKITALGLKTALESEYTKPFDTGEVDANGNPIFKSISEFAPDSPEWSTWTQNKLNKAFAGLEGVSPEIVAEHFTPEMGNQIFNITSHHIKEHKQFQFNQLLEQTPVAIEKASELAMKGDIETLKPFLNDHFQGLYKLGVTGSDANKMWKDALDNIFARGDLVAKSNNRTVLKKASSLPRLLAENIPYGQGGSKDLTSHPDFAEKEADFINDFYGKKKKAIEDKKDLETLLKDKEIEDLQTAIANEKDPAKANQMFEEYLNDPQNQDVRDEWNKLGMIDNQKLKTEIAPDIEAGIITGKYQSAADAITDINMYKSKHPTMDDEATEIFNDLISKAKTAKGIGSKVEDVVRDIMSPVKENLGKTFLGFQKPEKARQAVRLERQTNISIQKWALDFIKENDRVPNDNEWNQIQRQYQDQIFAEIDVLDPAEVERTYPVKEFDNPFKGITGKKIKKPIETPSVTSSESTSTQPKPKTKTSSEESFMAPDPSQMGNQSSNSVIDTVNQVVNALTGTQPAAAGTLTERRQNHTNKINSIADKYKGAVSYGSGSRADALAKEKTFIFDMKDGEWRHVYADPSSPEVIEEAKNIAADLATNTSLASSQERLAIAQMVLTEAIPDNEEDMIATMMSLLNRIARARLEIYEPPGYASYEKDIIDEITRPYQFEGVQGFKKEDLINAKPIKGTEKDLKRVFSVLFNDSPQIQSTSNN